MVNRLNSYRLEDMRILKRFSFFASDEPILIKTLIVKDEFVRDYQNSKHVRLGNTLNLLSLANL